MLFNLYYLFDTSNIFFQELLIMKSNHKSTSRISNICSDEAQVSLLLPTNF